MDGRDAAGLHDPVPFGYSHVVRVDAGELVFIAGQYGSGPDGNTDMLFEVDAIAVRPQLAAGRLLTTRD